MFILKSDKVIQEGAKPAILFLGSQMETGGAQRVLLTQADEFTRMGARVDIVLAHHQGEYLHQVGAGIQIVDLKASRMGFAVPKLAGYLRKQKPDMLLSTIELANIIAYLATKWSGAETPWVIRQVDYPQQFKPLVSGN